MKMTRNWVLTRDGEDIELAVEFDATPYIPATGPTFNSPGEPPEGGEIEILEVIRGGGPLAPPLTAIEEAALLDHLYESVDDSDFDPPGDY